MEVHVITLSFKMTRLATGLLLLLLAHAALAQNRRLIEIKTPDGRTVILKPDATWEYKEAAASPSPTPVPPGTTSLTPNFSGHDLGTLLVQLVDLRKRLTKSEFETTSAYETRAAAERKRPILDNLTVMDTFSLVASRVEPNTTLTRKR